MPFVTATGHLQDLSGRRSPPAGAARSRRSTVERGEMVAIMGASGVGKSTLLHLLGGLDRPDTGTIHVGEHCVTEMADADLVAFRNRDVGFVFQFHHLLPEFSAVENAEMPLRIARMRVAESRPRATALLTRVGLEGRLDHRPGHAVRRRAAAGGGRAGADHAAVAAAGRRADRRSRRGARPTRCTRCCATCIASSASPPSWPPTTRASRSSAIACCGWRAGS